jgi:hypothetical protein
MPRDPFPLRSVHAVDRGRGSLWWLAVSAAGAALAILAGLAAL